uniref:Uncharacterized protein n=1 Tax=Tetradesmus obliquus TaxID=3088 RepID=A0A383W750_TETOB|eukprot:jgi/Sobl393_1/6081/SZX72982.1
MAKRSTKAAAGAGRKRSRKEDDADENANFFLVDDDEAKNRQQESEEDEEQQETAEQKRIRLARAYLEDLRAATQGGDDEDDADGAAAAAGLDDDELAEKLRQDALEAQGRLQRRLAHRLLLPQQAAAAATSSSSSRSSGVLYGSGRFSRAHRLSPTALALTADEAVAFTVSKDGSILKWDVETMQRTQLVRPGSKAAKAAAAAAGTTADWVQKGPRMNATSSLLAAAVSSDGRYLAVGGGDKMVHVFEAGSGTHVQSYPGHRDQVSGLAFREGTHTLYSSGFDRTVKIWSLDDGAYVDTLFGHQAEVFALDAARAERVVSVGHDHTCRLWKIPEESHLVFRSPSMAQYAVSYVTGNEWVSGGADGSLQVWNTMKKKPQSVYRNAHVSRSSGAAAAAAPADAGPDAAVAAADADAADAAVAAGLPSKGSWSTAGVDTPGWIQSIAACKGSEIVASGAGDGFIRLWAVQPSRHGGAGSLKPVGALPAAGFVNGLALGRSGRLCVAALGQEPRLGRWGRVGNARNGLLVHRWELADDGASDGE